MNKNMIYIFIALFVMGMIGGCSKTAETLEEKLIAQEWAVVTASGDYGTMNFYDNNTASFKGDLISNGYEWSIENGQLTLVYDNNTFIYDVEEDDSNGYIFSLVDGDYLPIYTSYGELKLTPTD